ncbi:hypothetical protein [Aeromonas veronii]|uniref:Uncharacterized protein n=1 Tax=Aeromonas veronii TaxID=654 RepID=A0A4S5CJR2_AERVE|nr:hypothetical protein [Aeromonas veronii]THJ43588.1 hypothetical protein E8Q35_14880 [Aeromonas veronii]
MADNNAGVMMEVIEKGLPRAMGAEAFKTLRQEFGNAPIGESIVATLVAKTWGKSVNLNCFFHQEATGNKFMISVFREHAGQRYTDRAGDVDFSVAGNEGSIYELTIRKSSRSKFPALISAKLVEAKALDCEVT